MRVCQMMRRRTNVEHPPLNMRYSLGSGPLSLAELSEYEHKDVSEPHANVLVRPPFLYLGALFAGALIELFLPLGPGLAGGTLRRNPIYIGLSVLYAGLAIALTSGWALLALPIVIAVMNKGVIEREEAYLAREFGEDYLAYKKKVPRWL